MYIDIGCTDSALEAGHVLDGETMPENTLFFGDNLDVLRRYMPDESVDLVYLDPPFQSGRNYNILFQDRDGSRSAAQIKAFEDTWRWDEAAAAAYKEVVEEGGDVARVMQAFRDFLGTNDLLAYLSMMAPRLKKLRRVLKPTGSIYLHCDPTASHYLKLLMDAVFGPENFRNEIIWRRSTAHNKLSRKFGPIHDTLLFYSKTDDFTFHPGRSPYPKSYIESTFTKEDDRGPYRKNELTGSGTRGGSSGDPWRGFDPTPKGRHWAIPRSLRELLPDEGKGMTSQEKLDHLADMEDARIVLPGEDEEGWPRYKQYVGPGIPYQDIWAYQPGTRGVLYGTDRGIDEDVRWLEGEAERLGYPTQKPEGLLERIIESSSDPEDVVLDPFCGCGTTIAAAQKLGRKWVGIDITYQAISLIKRRLRDSFGEGVDFDVVGEPVSLPDAKRLAEHDRHQFELWALDLVDARIDEKKKGADKGIDGRLYFHDPVEDETVQIIISVKSGKTGPKHVRDLRGVVDREGAEIGVLITLQDPTRKMKEEAASAGFYESRWGNHPRIQILTVEELLEGATIHRPRLTGADRTFKEAPKAERAEPAKQEDLDLDAAGEGGAGGPAAPAD